MSEWTLTDDSFSRDLETLSGGSQQGQDLPVPEQKPAFNILVKLKQFRNDDCLCDVDVQVQDVKFRAHKAVLAAWSPVLASQIFSQPKLAKVLLVIDCDDKDVFCEVLEYCYSGVIVPNETNVLSLMDIGKNLMMDSLVTHCEDYLKLNVSNSNYVSNYFVALKYGLPNLEEHIVSFIEANMSTVIEQSELLSLSPQAFKTFLTLGKMGQLQQAFKFTLIINWVGYNMASRDKLLMYLLNHITWNHTVNDLLLQISCSKNIFTSSEFCLFQLLQSLVNATGHNLGTFVTSYPRLYSVYSHMLDDLSCPKIFLSGDDQVGEVRRISISGYSEFDQCDFKLLNNSHETKDAEMNTDVDSTYFQTGFQVETANETLHVENFGENVSESPIANTEDEHQAIVGDSGDHPEATSDPVGAEVKGFSEAVSDAEIVGKETLSTSAKHRRKNRPRKISISKPNPEKKGRGRPRKNPLKNDIVDDEKREESAADKDESESKEVAEIDANKQEVQGELEADQIEGPDEEKELNTDPNYQPASEAKPKLKMSFKLRQSKGKSKQTRLKNAKRKTQLEVEACVKQSLPYKCSFESCDYSTRTLGRLEKHVECAHNIDVQLDCKRCAYTTNLMRDFCAHMKSHFTKVPYQCIEEGCNHKSLRIGLLVRHEMTHMTEKPYKCEVCTKSFASFSQLSYHKRAHEGRQFECDVCLKKFLTKGAMQQHRAVHFDNKPYLCDTCGFSTKHLSHLISHRKIHSGEVLRCTFPNCNYSTPKQGHMTQHVNTHLNIRNHTCQVCGKSFVVRGKLLRHERIHLKEKLFKCKQCDYQTSRTDRMKLHIESHGIKFKKKKYNLPNVEEEKTVPEIDYHQLYEKNPPLSSEASIAVSSLSNLNMVSMTEMKPLDAISLAASASMIVDSFSNSRIGIMDSLNAGTATIVSLEDIQNAGFQTYDRFHAGGTFVENL